MIDELRFRYRRWLLHRWLRRKNITLFTAESIYSYKNTENDLKDTEDGVEFRRLYGLMSEALGRVWGRESKFYD